MRQEVKCPKCEKVFPMAEWLVIGAVHVIFDCDGVPTTRQTTLNEVIENESVEEPESGGEEE